MRALAMRIERLSCFQHVNWRPDSDELRRFALSMLLGFALLAVASIIHRHRLSVATWALWGAGLSLALAALVPGLGRAVYLAVYLLTSLVGYGISHVVLTVVFLFLFVPVGLGLRLIGKDLLRLKPPAPEPEWIQRSRHQDDSSYYRQF